MPPLENVDPDEPGLLVGDYRLEEVIGEGGNAKVWRGTHVASGSSCALKILKPFADAAKGARRRARFDREIATMKDLAANGIRGIMPVLDSGVLEPTQRPWYAMPIAGRLESPSVERCRWAIETGIDVCRILEEMWEIGGATHRDIKPSNILVLNGVVTLADFGLALSEDDSDLTVTGEVAGSQLYQAPEAPRLGHTPNPAGDVFSVGKTIWELCAGRPPDAFGPLTSSDALEESCEGVPEGFDELLLLATRDARTPQDVGRPSAKNLASALQTILEPSSSGAPAPGPQAAKIALGLFGSEAPAAKIVKATEQAVSYLQQAAGNAFKASWNVVASELGWPEIRGGGGTVAASWNDQGYEQAGRYFEQIDVEGVAMGVSLAFYLDPSADRGNIRLGTSIVLSSIGDQPRHIEIASCPVETFHQGPGLEVAKQTLVEFAGGTERMVRLMQEIRKLVDSRS